jgi:hypothetical protein
MEPSIHGRFQVFIDSIQVSLTLTTSHTAHACVESGKIVGKQSRTMLDSGSHALSVQLLNETRQELKGERSRAASLQLHVQAMQAAASLSSCSLLGGQASASCSPPPHTPQHPATATSRHSVHTPPAQVLHSTVRHTSQPCTPGHSLSPKQSYASPSGCFAAHSGPPNRSTHVASFEATPSEPSARRTVDAVAVPVGFSYHPTAAQVPTTSICERPMTQNQPVAHLHDEPQRPASVPLAMQRPRPCARSQLYGSHRKMMVGEESVGIPAHCVSRPLASSADSRCQGLELSRQEQNHLSQRIGSTFGSPAAAGMLNLLEGVPAHAAASARQPRSHHRGNNCEIMRLSSADNFSTRGGVSRHMPRPRTVSAGCHVNSERPGAVLRNGKAGKACALQGDLVAFGGSGGVASVVAVSRRLACGTARKASGVIHAKTGSAAMPSRQARPAPAQTGLTRSLLPSHEANLT